MKKAVAWMAQNSVAANILLFIMVVGGLFFLYDIKQEVFPDFEIDVITVSVVYPGASPEEVEEGLVLAIEDKVRSLDGVKRVFSFSGENSGVVYIELLENANVSKALQDVKNGVDSIQSFPEEAERPLVNLVELKRQAISLIVYGDQDRKTLREFGEKMRDDLLQTGVITSAEVVGAPPLEISVEVPQKNLRTYNLKLRDIANIIGRTSVDLPGGGVKSTTGEVLVRTKEKRDLASEYENIPVVINPNGTVITLNEIASVREIFEETFEESNFNGKPAVYVDVYRVGDQNPVEISKTVHEYINELRKQLPPSLKVATWNDTTIIYVDRINLLLKNAFLGLILVLVLLALFLEPSLAFWVTTGIPVSIIGSFLLIPWTEASINMISLFAFIVTLGIIVDDAILVGENVYHKREKGLEFEEAAIVGAEQMIVPVSVAVLTNIIAFLPLLFISGASGKFFIQIPLIVISVFTLSWIESLFVLPAHLTYKHKKGKIYTLLNKPNKIFEKKLKYFIENFFRNQVKAALSWRYLTLASSVGVLIFLASLIGGGHLPFTFIPKIDSDVIISQVILPYGVPVEKTKMYEQRLTAAANRVLENNGGQKISEGMISLVGKYVGGDVSGAILERTGSHLLTAIVWLVPSDQRKISGVQFANQWREEMGPTPEVKSISFVGETVPTSGKPIEFRLNHNNLEILESAAKELAQKLKFYKGVKDIDDGSNLGKPQISFKLKPEGRSLNLSSADLGDQIRSSFYGAEALRDQRGRDEIKVMVRLPEEERKTIETVEELIVRTPNGGEIPLSEAAIFNWDRAFTQISRYNGKRSQLVSADMDTNLGNANEVVDSVIKNVMPDLYQKYPGLQLTFSGQIEEQKEAIKELTMGFIMALFGIYALLAIPFKSYTQPFIVMLSIPFGIIGALLGHILLGYGLSIISMFGMVALSGVVVNDSLVLIMTINKNLRELNMTVMDAVVDASCRRFRPIMLTSLTTFFGLSPMIFETSLQARFLIPMAISLGFGVLMTTCVIFLVTASLYLILDDIKNFFGNPDAKTR